MEKTLSACEGDTRLALELLEDSTAIGFWYSEILLRYNPNLKSLHGNPVFESLVERNIELKSLEESQFIPALVIRPEGRCNRSGSPCPLLLSLHANRSSASQSLSIWEPAAAAGWLVAAVQSSQGLWKGGYVWEDSTTAAYDVKKSFDSINNHYEIQKKRVVLAGISGSAFSAIQLVIQQVIPAAAFLALILEETTPLISLDNLTEPPSIVSSVIKGHFVINSARVPPKSINNFIQTLKARGISCSIEWVDLGKEQFGEIINSSLVRGLEILSLK